MICPVQAAKLEVEAESHKILRWHISCLSSDVAICAKTWLWGR